jgi:hypothetical protein
LTVCKLITSRNVHCLSTACNYQKCDLETYDRHFLW